eukprot:COSAG01_NODE_5261_length_4376_cov_137.949497_2_plen_947_part_00
MSQPAAEEGVPGSGGLPAEPFVAAATAPAAQQPPPRPSSSPAAGAGGGAGDGLAEEPGVDAGGAGAAAAAAAAVAQLQQTLLDVEFVVHVKQAAATGPLDKDTLMQILESLVNTALTESTSAIVTPAQELMDAASAAVFRNNKAAAQEALQCMADVGGYAAVLARAERWREDKDLTPALLCAAFNGDPEMLSLFFQQLPPGAACLNFKSQARFGYTALHIACEQGSVDVVRLLVEHNCDASVHNNQGATAWDCAVMAQQQPVLDLLHELAAKTHPETGETLHRTLSSELQRQITAMQNAGELPDDPMITPFGKLVGWGTSTEPFPNWIHLSVGAQGNIWLVVRVHPAIFRRDASGKQRRHQELVVKQIKDEEDRDELTAEYKGLVNLRNPYIVQVIGTTYGPTPEKAQESAHASAASPNKGWMLLLEKCDDDLDSLLNNPATAPSLPMSAKIAHMVADGMAYIHERGVHHYDLKTKNVLYIKNGDDITVKIADFGMLENEATETADFSPAAEGTASPAQMAQTTKPPGDSASRPIPTADGDDLVDPVGTYEYMAPEALDGNPVAASDSWSYGVFLHTLFSRSRLAEAFPGGMEYFQRRAELVHTTAAEALEDPVTGIAARAARGERAHFDDAFFPEPLRQLIEACWAHDPAKRPVFALPKGAAPQLRILDIIIELEHKAADFEQQRPAAVAQIQQRMEEQARVQAQEESPGCQATADWLQQNASSLGSDPAFVTETVLIYVQEGSHGLTDLRAMVEEDRNAAPEDKEDTDLAELLSELEDSESSDLCGADFRALLETLPQPLQDAKPLDPKQPAEIAAATQAADERAESSWSAVQEWALQQGAQLPGPKKLHLALQPAPFVIPPMEKTSVHDQLHLIEQYLSGASVTDDAGRPLPALNWAEQMNGWPVLLSDASAASLELERQLQSGLLRGFVWFGQGGGAGTFSS